MTPLDRLHARLATLGPMAIAVSGGLDSLTLATAAHRALGSGATMHHATSPAVPLEATSRVRALAAAEHWQLDVFDGGGYGTYDAVARRTSHQIVSGTHLDDLRALSLAAPVSVGVRHPFVEADIDKLAVRRVAATLGLGALADLPATAHPSANRMRLEGPLLEMVQQMERLVAVRLSPQLVHCHLSIPNGVRCAVIELDEPTLSGLDAHEAAQLQSELQPIAAAAGVPTVAFAAHRAAGTFFAPL